MRNIGILFFLLLAPSVQAQYNLQSAFSNLPPFSLPVEMMPSVDGSNRLFVVQQRGRIYVFENTTNVTARKEFLNLSDKVSQSGSETGLLGLAFHPNYATNGYFYVNYTATVAGQLQTFISRFQVSSTNPDSAIKASELVLINVNQPYSNHNGGKLLFGPDDYLYIALGDGGFGGDPQNNAQNRSVLLGKILRINVDSPSGGLNYSIPPTNPFAGNTQGFREEIYAYGMRNPWKMSFDPVSGRFWAADVGQNVWEEIDIIQNGGNYGWRIMEANACYNPSSGCDETGLLKPVWAYSHSNGDASITGGFVYRGSSIPLLVGKYIYADYVSGRIWALTYDGITTAINQMLIDTPYLISSFGEDNDRNLYVLSYQEGRLYKLVGPSTGIESEGAKAPTRSFLGQNFPNPVSTRDGNSETSFEFSVGTYGHTSLRVFDVLGREIATLVNEMKQPGVYTARFNPRAFGAGSLPSGVYFYRLQTADAVQQRTMILIK